MPSNAKATLRLGPPIAGAALLPGQSGRSVLEEAMAWSQLCPERCNYWMCREGFGQGHRSGRWLRDLFQSLPYGGGCDGAGNDRSGPHFAVNYYMRMFFSRDRPASRPGGLCCYFVRPLSLSQAAAASFGFCFWLPLTARLRLSRSSVVRVRDTAFRASLALSLMLALL